MGVGYSDKLTLAHIFNNKSLAKVLPIGDYKEKSNRKGKIDDKAQMRIIANQVMDIAKQSAVPYYSPLKVKWSNRSIVISGTLTKSYDGAYNAIFRAVDSKKRLLASLATNNELIRMAWLENKGKFPMFGDDTVGQGQYLRRVSPKLLLRAKSVADIKQMNDNELLDIVNDIVDNIKYSGNYPQTVSQLGIRMDTQQYRQAQAKWRKKVGLI
ncbi:MAG: hypothetical protein LBK70_00345 [Clostridiales bacterium]|jgi:hypothetical protein|nr:hypothetical protein [Clostridiales bacterium]